MGTETGDDEDDRPRYPLTWDLRKEDPPGVSYRFCETTGRGGCDAAVLFSITHERGGFGLAIVSLDGRTGELVEDGELFKAWAILAHRLAESATLAPGQKELAHAVHEYVRRIVTAH